MTRFDEQSEEYKKLLDEIYELHQSKGKDYGHSGDHYSNLRESARIFMPDKPAWIAPQIRLLDKIIRVQNIIRNGKAENEPIRDSLRDISVYALNSLHMFDEDERV